MFNTIIIIVLAVLAVAGLGVSAWLILRSKFDGTKIDSARERAENIVTQAEGEQRKLLLAAQEEVLRLRTEGENEVKEQPGSASVVQSISVDRYGIGYSGIGYKTAGIRALPIAEKGTSVVKPTARNVFSGDYPIPRFLYVYVNKTLNALLKKVAHTLEWDLRICFNNCIEQWDQ